MDVYITYLLIICFLQMLAFELLKFQIEFFFIFRLLKIGQIKTSLQLYIVHFVAFIPQINNNHIEVIIYIHFMEILNLKVNAPETLAKKIFFQKAPLKYLYHDFFHSRRLFDVKFIFSIIFHHFHDKKLYFENFLNFTFFYQNFTFFYNQGHIIRVI